MSNLGINPSLTAAATAAAGGCSTSHGATGAGAAPNSHAAWAPAWAPTGGLLAGGGHAAFPMPNLQMAGMFGSMAPAAMPLGAMGQERFMSSMTGGVILGQDGAPAGRIPEGSFVDTTNGAIYGPDSKPITLPQGATADFFDLPSVKDLVEEAKLLALTAGSTPTMVGGAMHAPGKTDYPGTGMHQTHQSYVDGQWGPGGVTALKGGGGAAAADGCDSMHGSGAASKTSASTPSTTAGGSTPSTTAGGSRPSGKAHPATPTRAATPGTTVGSPGSMTGGGATTAVAGASGGGMAPAGSLTTQLAAIIDQISKLLPTMTSGGGGTLTAAGAPAKLGSTDGLRMSVDDLVDAIRALDMTLQRVGMGRSGGGPGPLPTHPPNLATLPMPSGLVPPVTTSPAAPTKSTTAAPVVEAPKAPVVEPPRTELPSSSTSTSTSTGTTAAPSSGSSSS